ncbi:beta-carotene 3-hydroxylase, chloroplastic-like isoform X2 [Phalaenopsis equestris]|uniref:beta-carotene 3-hydroxylase, chloroplastic-like isoform X2 n=1 Tax=Phalaenopsis equestris TaxID=78828 RepID=UPI0009E65170|nr:beta-carotene 3-hydroxylase, chloroplastic-like isoform X2 [Phalaenopsis equestris]
MASTILSSPTVFLYQILARKPSSFCRGGLGFLSPSTPAPPRPKSSIINPLIAGRKRGSFVGFVGKEDGLVEEEEDLLAMRRANESNRVLRRSESKRAERRAYLVAAMMSSSGFIFTAAAAVYYKFAWQMEVGMEYWARWAHRALWHASLWPMHKSHHRPREGPFEVNDVFAIINAIPAIALLSFGFFHRGFFSGLCFGAGLGITLFGMAYMFVHDGLVHRRFPVGPIANVPYFQRVAAAHLIHHTDKFNGVPYGLFLGPKELEEVGGTEELEREIKRRIN